jgi:hypothetical protein
MKFRNRTSTRAFTLVEAAVCTIIVASMLVAALRATALSGVYQYRMSERATARFLTDAMVTDIIKLNYKDPGSAPLFGQESTESAASKSNYNDVDDFNGWTESPPQYSDGTATPGLTGWQRHVTVQWVNSSNINQISLVETGAKRITITVSHNSVPILTRTVLRTNAP